MDAQALIMLVGMVFSAGASWGGAHYALNGTRKRVQTIEEWSAKHDLKDDTRHTDAIDRLARIETKIDVLMKD